MMMAVLRWLFLLCAIVLTGAAADAQITTVPVRAGEHAQFTRLVIRMPQDNGWRVTAEGRVAHLIVDGPELQFDLTQTFSKIPRTRLRAMRVTADGLAFDLACDCALRANEDIPQFLVIDILGQAEPPGDSLAIPRPAPRPEGLVPRDGARAPELDRAGRDLARQLRGDPEPAERWPPLSLHPALLPAPTGSVPLPGSDSQTADQAARDAIARELGRAVSASIAQGRLQAEEDFSSAPPIRYASGIGGALDAHVSVPHGGNRGLPSAGMETCRLLALVDVQNGGPTASLPPGLPTLTTIFGEFDQPDRERLIELIRHYLSIGFGAEARLGAALLAPDDPLRGIVLAISHAVDLDPRVEGMAPDGIASCGPAGLLWAFLLDPAYPVDTDAALNMLVQASEALPALLRVHLGPTLVQRLISRGHVSAAQRVQAAISRVTQTVTPELQLASVAVALAGSGLAQDRSLEATLSPELSDEALVFLLARRDQHEEPVDAELAALAENRLLALRGDPLGARISGLLARAYARDAAFDAAFALAHARHNGLTGAEARELHHWLLNQLAATPDDTVFVVSVFSQRPWLDADLPRDLRAALAARLERLGFADQAALLREGPPPDDSAPGEAQGSASPGADSAADAPDQTTDLVSRARAAQAQLQAERAGTARGPDTAASAATVQSGSDPSDPEQAILPDPVEHGASILMAGEGAQPTASDLSHRAPDPGLLTQARSALDESQDLRARLQAMLARAPSEDGGNPD
ncbi:hypothetical protein [Natronohydrobacter thiooxidans]|uniref:hypothetical protein n=1 Tax=Natronohydrobacter thiooxidans TaxID=87172 RepID=UPI0008FF17E4|nr:hypothetical protein [Natronohydrobacter thiooxidans]